MSFWLGSFWIDLVALFIAGAFSVVIYFKYKYSFWKKHGIPYIEPSIPAGNVGPFLRQTQSLGSNLNDLYDKLKATGAKYGGIYMLHQPVFLPIDPEMVKTILTKEFQYFTDRGVWHDEKKAPLTGNLFSLDGGKWRTLRAKLTPTFTSGKMRMMFPILVEVGKNLEDVVEKKARTGEPVDIKDTLARFTTDIIASSAFGLECDSLHEKDNEFRKWGNEVFNITGFKKKLSRMLFFLPKTLDFIKSSLQDRDVANFYIGVVKEMVEYRESKNVKRKDFMDLLLQMKVDGKLYPENISNANKSDTRLTFNEIAAQCFIFFLAGFETSSTTMTFCLYEVCRNQEIQDKMREEIHRVLKAHNGEFTYEAMMEMTYMDQVVNETLRLHPPATQLIRECTMDFKLPGSNSYVKKGTKVIIPISAYHMDPEYYPNPEEFDPERFNDVNKNSRHPYTHIPFGEGPRICIGMRFALMQTKVGLTTLLGNFKLTLNPETPVPLPMNTITVVSTSDKTIWLDAERLVV